MTEVVRHISPLEAVVLTAAATFAASVFMMPRLLVGDAGRAGGVALLLLGLGAVVWAVLLSRISDVLPDRALAQEIVQRLGLGGRAFLALFALFEILVASGTLRQYVSLGRAVIIPEISPVWTSILIACSAFSGARQRLEGLARSVLVFFGLAALLAVVCMLVLLARARALADLLPGPSIALAPIGGGALDAAFLFAGLAAIALFLPYQTPRRRGLPHVAQGAVVSLLLMLLAYAGTVATAGPNYVLTQVWPVVSALRTIVLRNFLFDRFGLVVVIAWSAIVLSFAAVHIWASGESICQATGQGGLRPLFTLGAAAAVAWTSDLYQSQAEQEAIARGVLTPLTVAFLLAWLCAALWLRLGARRSRRKAEAA